MVLLCYWKHQEEGGQNVKKGTLKVNSEEIQMSFCLFSSVTSCCWFWRISWFRGQTCASYWWVPPWMQSFFLSTFTPVQLLTYQVKTIHVYYLVTFIVLGACFQYFCLQSVSQFRCKGLICKVARWGFIQELWFQGLRRKDQWDLGERRLGNGAFFCTFSIPAEFPSSKDKNDMACMTWFPELVSPQLKTSLSLWKSSSERIQLGVYTFSQMCLLHCWVITWSMTEARSLMDTFLSVYQPFSDCVTKPCLENIHYLS